jgi:hypothetical protein
MILESTVKYGIFGGDSKREQYIFNTAHELALSPLLKRLYLGDMFLVLSEPNNSAYKFTAA